MPVIIQKKKTFISLFALDVNRAVQISEIFLGAADRTEDQAFVHRRLLPGRAAAESEADDGRVGRRGRRILAATPARARARTPRTSASRSSTTRASRRARPTSSPIVRALQAANPDIVIVCSYPLELGRHRAGGERAQLQAEDDRRRHGRPAGHRVQEQARAEAQRHRQLRDLGAVGEDDGAGRRLLQEIPGAGQAAKASIRSAIISAAGATPISTCWAKRSPAPRASTTTRSPTGCARHTHKTIMGDWSYGPNGEWTKSGMMQVQYHDIKEGAGLETGRA